MTVVNYLADTEITWKAKGLLKCMEDFRRGLTLEELLKLSKDGYTSVQNGLQELTANNYYYSAPIRDSKGKFIAFKQNVRFTRYKPQYHLEKVVIDTIKKTTRLNDNDKYIIETAISALSEDKENSKLLILEVNGLKNLGYENAEIVLKELSL